MPPTDFTTPCGVRLRLNQPTPEQLDEGRRVFLEAHYHAFRLGEWSSDEAFARLMVSNCVGGAWLHFAPGPAEEDGMAARYHHLAAALLVYADTGAQVYKDALDHTLRQFDPLGVAAFPHLMRVVG